MKAVYTILASFLLATFVLDCFAAEEKPPSEQTNDVVLLKLQDFKFVPAKAITNPGDVFRYDENGDRLCFYTNLAAETKFRIRTAGDYNILVTAAGDSALQAKPKFKITVDDKDVGEGTSLKTDSVKMYRTPIALKAGEHTLRIAFLNNAYKENEYDSNLYLHGVKLAPQLPLLERKSKK